MVSAAMSLHAGLLGLVRDRLRPPYLVVLGSPAQAAQLAAELGPADTTCYQMDLYQAQRLAAEAGLAGRVETRADLWDLAPVFNSAVFPVQLGGERSLKLDMVEQAFHVLRPQGKLAVLSPHAKDDLFGPVIKKVYGKVHARPAEGGSVFWGVRTGSRPRRRHEVVFQASVKDEPPLTFRSRPGVFSHGRFDPGAQALVEVMTIRPGDRVLDLGCGVGTNGVFAGRRAGPGGFVLFLDSNVRAAALAEENARTNGLSAFESLAAASAEGLPPRSFDVVLANPPYYAQLEIAGRFIAAAADLLRPDGRLYLVTRLADQLEPIVAENFPRCDVFTRRGYCVFCASNS